jgi:3-hydroxypropanoate dehydrogenase
MTALAVETCPTVTLPQLDDAGRALLFTQARTANTFADTAVGDDELAASWELAKWAPPATGAADWLPT